MLRIISIVVLLFGIGKVSAQAIELQGRYGASFIGGESIEFVGRDSFYFSGFYCTCGVTGKGTCEIIGNHLYLYFEKTKVKKDTTHIYPDVISYTPHPDSLVVSITCLDSGKNAIDFASVQLRLKDGATVGSTTNNNGKVWFRIKGRTQNVSLIVSAISYKTKQLELLSSGRYELVLFHETDAEFSKNINQGEVYVYEIDELHEDLILMRPNGSNEKFRKYVKK